MMKKISHSILFVLLSAVVGAAFAAKYYPPSEIVETTNPATAEAVLQQAREIQMRDNRATQPTQKKTYKNRHGKKRTTVKKTRTVTEETAVQ